ncbi:MAG: PEP-CTERM sorting domain-containing protein [Planctomycetes bacterium]|nr:PEP-CTERM sorting domain-containing protein [Planctomycetota bacterium]
MLKKLVILIAVLALAVPASAELLVDGDLEGETAWTKGVSPSGAAGYESWAQYTGSRGMAMKAWDDQGTGYAYQDVSVAASTAYDYTLWGSRDAGAVVGDYYMKVEWYAGATLLGSDVQDITAGLSDVWAEQTLSTTSMAGSDTARVMFGSNGGVDFRTGKFDDAAFGGLLADTSFEERWTLSGAVGYEGWANREEGTRGAALKTWDGDTGDARYEDIGVVAGTEYVYTLWGLSDPGAIAGSYYMEVEWYDGATLLGSDILDITAGLTDADWTQFSLTATAMAGSDTACITFGGVGVNVIGKFDDASFSEVPEPATMALLGLGGLALLRRKRS